MKQIEEAQQQQPQQRKQHQQAEQHQAQHRRQAPKRQARREAKLKKDPHRETGGGLFTFWATIAGGRQPGPKRTPKEFIVLFGPAARKLYSRRQKPSSGKMRHQDKRKALDYLQRLV